MLLQRISIGPSALIAIAVSIVHLAAAGLLWLIPIPVAVKALLTLCIAISLIFFMARDAALHGRSSIVALELREEGDLACQTRAGEWLECELLGTTYVSPQLTVIHLRPRGWSRQRRVILVPDNVDQRDFRRLRMWLRWRSATTEPGAIAGR